MPYGVGNINPGRTNLHSSGQLVPVKVMDVILDLDHPLSERYGFWDSLGMIFYIKVSKLVTNPELESSIKRNDQGQILTTMDRAKPLFANLKYYPLKGEVVMALSSTKKTEEKKQTYYLPNLNIWNHPHHNAIPNPNVDDAATQNDYKSYDLSGGGLVRHVTDGATDIPLGRYFREQMNIKPLLPFEGDHILEGRFGNSIRFGSTARNKEGTILGSNNWSQAGQIGDPITIIRNGQSDELDNKGWEPTTEDVNRDPSSIYLTSTQKLDNFNPASTNWQSWGAEPTIVEDPIAALTSPPAEDIPQEEVNGDAWGSGDEDSTSKEKENVNVNNLEEEESDAKAPPETDNKDELSLYDELIESGDYEEDDFENVMAPEDIGFTPIEYLEDPLTGFPQTNEDGSYKTINIDVANVTSAGSLAVPLMAQQDAKWSSTKTRYTVGGTLSYGPAGCANLSCCMVASFYQNKIITPFDLMGSPPTNNLSLKDSTPNGSGVLCEWDEIEKTVMGGRKYKAHMKGGKGAGGTAIVDFLVAKIDAKIPVIWEKKQVKIEGKKHSGTRIAYYGQSEERSPNVHPYVGGTQHWMVIVGYTPSTSGGNPTFQVNDPNSAAFRPTVPVEDLVKGLGRFVTFE
jgi:hypothetical protein